MSYKGIVTILAIFTVSLLLNSCGSSTSPSTDYSGYMPMKTGNYWIYEGYDLDKDNNKVSESEYTDSVFISGPATKGGKSCWEQITITDGSDPVSNFIYNSGSKFYQFFEGLDNGFFPIGLNSWVMMADFEGTTWKIMDTTISNIEVPDMQGLKFNATISLSSKKGIKTNKSVLGKSYEAQEFILIIEIKTSLLLNITKEVKTYFVNNIGMVETYSPTVSVTIPIVNQTIEIPGFRTSLLRYKVN